MSRYWAVLAPHLLHETITVTWILCCFGWFCKVYLWQSQTCCQIIVDAQRYELYESSRKNMSLHWLWFFLPRPWSQLSPRIWCPPYGRDGICPYKCTLNIIILSTQTTLSKNKAICTVSGKYRKYCSHAASKLVQVKIRLLTWSKNAQLIPCWGELHCCCCCCWNIMWSGS